MPYADKQKQRQYSTNYAREVFSVRHRERLRQYQRTWELKNPQRYLWNSAKARAKKRGFSFSIDPSDIVIPAVCPVLGIPLEFKARRTENRRVSPNAPTVDRIDPSRGYEKGNICVISFRANDLKSDGRLQEFQALVCYLKDK